MSPSVSPARESRRIVARNRKARHDYQILETWEAGLVLVGTEVKSVRAGKVSLKGAFALVRHGELWLEGANIAAYDSGGYTNHDPKRARKLLLHRREMRRLIGYVEQRGLTLVPLDVYITRKRAKVTLALARGKKAHDRREDIKRRDAEREMARALRRKK